MALITIFELRPQSPAYRRLQLTRRLIGAIAMIVVASPFGVVRAGDDDRAKSRSFFYQAYSDAEIQAAVQRPLGLEDCIRIALAKNISLRIAHGDLDRADAAHAGSYGRFLPVFSVDGVRSNNLTGERRTTAITLVTDPQDSTETNELETVGFVDRVQFDNNAAIIGQAQLFLPTGGTLQFSKDFAHSAQIPLFQDPISPADDPLDREFTPTTKDRDLSYEISLSQPLLREAGPTVARSAFLATRYDQQIQERNLLSQKLQTVFAVKRAYYTALLQRELINVNLTALVKDSALVEASKALIVARLATRRDVLSAEIRFADDRASLLASRSDYQFALDRLKYELGLPIDMAVDLDSTGLSYTPMTLDEKMLVQQALENSPEVLVADLSIRKSRLQRQIAKNDLWPQLDLVASYSSERSKNAISNLDRSRTGGWRASLNLSYEFLSQEARASAEEAEISVRQQEDRLLDVQRQVMIDVRDIVRGVYSATAELDAIKAGIRVAEDKLEFSTTMFNLGRASNFDITESQEFLLKAKNQYLRKLVDYHSQLAQLESLIGRPITQ